jgi:hypothetical protein
VQELINKMGVETDEEWKLEMGQDKVNVNALAAVGKKRKGR